MSIFGNRMIIGKVIY